MWERRHRRSKGQGGGSSHLDLWGSWQNVRSRHGTEMEVLGFGRDKKVRIRM